MKVDLLIVLRFNIIYIMRLLSITRGSSQTRLLPDIALLYYFTKTVAYGAFLNYFSNTSSLPGVSSRLPPQDSCCLPLSEPPNRKIVLC